MDTEYKLTTGQAAEYLGYSKDTIYNYMSYGWLVPKLVRSSRGTKKYLFSEDDLNYFKNISPETILEMMAEQDRTGENRVAQDRAGLGRVGKDSAGTTEENVGNIEVSAQDSVGLGRVGKDRVGQDSTGADHSIVEILKHQLEVKDGQIAEKDRQIGDLHKELGLQREQNVETTKMVLGLQQMFLASPAKKEEPAPEYKVRQETPPSPQNHANSPIVERDETH